MRIKNPRQASPNEVKISRQSDGAVIEFTDPTISTTHFKIGPQIRQMSDQAILDMFNGMIAARDRLAAEYENIVIVCGGAKVVHGSGGIFPSAGGVKLCHL